MMIHAISWNHAVTEIEIQTKSPIHKTMMLGFGTWICCTHVQVKPPVKRSPQSSSIAEAKAGSGPKECYPLVIKHGWLENGPFICDFPIQTSIPSNYRGFSSQPCLITRGYILFWYFMGIECDGIFGMYGILKSNKMTCGLITKWWFWMLWLQSMSVKRVRDGLPVALCQARSKPSPRPGTKSTMVVLSFCAVECEYVLCTALYSYNML